MPRRLPGPIEGRTPDFQLDRRRFLKTGLAAGVAGIGLSVGEGALLDVAQAQGSHRGQLSDVEHVVILMQENRSFDHYFGPLSGRAGVLQRTRAQTDRRRVAVSRFSNEFGDTQTRCWCRTDRATASRST